MSYELDEYEEEFSEPTVAACARHAGRTFADEWVVFLLVGLVVGAVAVFQDALLNCGGVVGLAGFGLLVLIAGPLKWGYRYMCLRAVSGREPHADDVLRPFDRYYEVVVAHFMVLAMVVVGFCLLIVPGVFLYLRTRYVPFLVVEEGMDAVAAIRESFEMSAGQTGTLLGITGLGWLAVIAGAIPLGLGVLPALIWWDLTVASLYHATLLSEAPPSLEAPLTDPSIA